MLLITSVIVGEVYCVLTSLTGDMPDAYLLGGL